MYSSLEEYLRKHGLNGFKVAFYLHLIKIPHKHQRNIPYCNDNYISSSKPIKDEKTESKYYFKVKIKLKYMYFYFFA